MPAAFVCLNGTNGKQLMLPRRAWEAFAKGVAVLLPRYASELYRPLDAGDARVIAAFLNDGLRLLREGKPSWCLRLMEACPDFFGSSGADKLAFFLWTCGGAQVAAAGPKDAEPYSTFSEN